MIDDQPGTSARFLQNDLAETAQKLRSPPAPLPCALPISFLTVVTRRIGTGQEPDPCPSLVQKEMNPTNRLAFKHPKYPPLSLTTSLTTTNGPEHPAHCLSLASAIIRDC